MVYQRHDYQFWPSYLPKRTEGEGADAYRYEGDARRLTSENTVSYSKKFVSGHYFDAMAGFSATHETANFFSLKAEGLLTDDLKWNNMNSIGSKENYNASTSSNKVVRESVLMRLNYNYKSRYYFTFTGRYDGSSNFAENNKWGFFPSAAVKWNAKNENFLKQVRWLDELSLRLSAGRTGNDAIATYRSLEAYGTTTNGYLFGGTQSASFFPSRVANPNLTWEKTYMTNIGLDFAFLNSRLSGSVDIYNKDTRGILISLPAPLEHGTSTVPDQNAGEVNNKGFELDLHWADRIGKVSYDIGCNLGFVNNKVTKFQGDVSSINGVYKTQEGRPINQLYVVTVDRIVRDQTDLDYVQSLVDRNPDYFATYQRPELGDFLYRDANGDGKLDTDDRVEIGHGTLPRLTYGISLGLSWNNFDFSALFQGVGNHQVYYNNQAFRFITVMGQSLIKDITDNAWTPDNPYDSTYPILRNNANGKNNIASDAFVHNAAYFRCKNIQLGYTIPQHITRKFFVENLKVYASIDNLFTLTDFPGLDPEVGANVGYPAVRQYSVGLNISF